MKIKANEYKLSDINLWDIIPFLHCLMYADTHREYSLKDVVARFQKGLNYLTDYFPPKEDWVQDEINEFFEYITISNVDAVMGIEGDKGTIIRNAYLCAVVSVNLKTIRRKYMNSTDERFKARHSDNEYDSILRDEYTALGACATYVEKRHKEMFPALGYLLSHYPLPIDPELLEKYSNK